MPSKQGSVNKIRSYCPQCTSACPIVCHVEDGVLVKVTADREHPSAKPLCSKGRAGPELVYNKQRLQYPMRRTRPKGDPDPGWERISWDEALNTIASQLNKIKDSYGAEAVVMGRCCHGGSPGNTFVEWASRLAFAFGTPNIVTTTHICQWHRDFGSRYTYGTGMPQPDFDHTACILIWGHNPTATSRTNLQGIKQALKRGAKLIIIDPRRIELVPQADLWLRVKPGTDLALALSLLNVTIEEKLYDAAFARDWTTAPFLVRGDNQNLLKASDLSSAGDPKSCVAWDTSSRAPCTYNPATGVYQASTVRPALDGSYVVKLTDGRQSECKTAFQLLKEAVSQYTPARTQAITGVPEEEIRQAARMFMATRPACYFTFVGIEQNTTAMQMNRALCILYALSGNYDAAGGNFLPAVPRVNPIRGNEFLPPGMREKCLGLKERPLGPPGGGDTQPYDMYNAILTGKPYPVKGLLEIGGNMVISSTDSLRGREALSRLDFYAQVDLFLTPSAQLADIVLPAATFYESPRLRTFFPGPGDAWSHVQLCQAVIPPLYESRPDLEIIFDLAKALGLGDKFWNGDLEAAFNYQLAPTGLTVRSLRDKPEGVSLNLATEYQKYRHKDPKTGVPAGFSTPSKRIELYSQAFKDRGYAPLPLYQETASKTDDMYPLILTVGRVEGFCHTQHRALPSLRRAVPHPFLEINPAKARELGISQGDWVAVETSTGSIRLKAKVTNKVTPEVVCAQMGWWQGCPELGLPAYDPFSREGANINLLTSVQAVDPVSGSEPLKACPCQVHRIVTGKLHPALESTESGPSRRLPLKVM